MLLGGRSGRVTLVQDPQTGESIQVIDDDNSKPALELIFEFFREPRSSLPARLWSAMLCVASTVRIFQLSILTLDGPHFYEGRNHDSMYPYLPSKSQHAAIFLAMCVPLMFDTILRCIFVCTILLDKGSELYEAVMQDSVFWILLIMGLFGAIHLACRCLLRSIRSFTLRGTVRSHASFCAC